MEPVHDLGQPLNVVVVSDDRVWLTAVGALFASRGVRVLETWTDTEGADAPDVVVVETDGADGDRLRLVDELRAASPLTEVVVVASSGRVPEAVRALRSGAFTVLRHPVAPAALLESVSQAGARHRRAVRRIAELERTSTGGRLPRREGSGG